MWRIMGEADIPALVAISDAVHGRFSEQPAIYRERLALYPAGCFVHDQGGAVTGYLITHPWRRLNPVPLDEPIGALPADADSYYLHDVALLPAARGTGAGAAALAQTMICAQEAGFDEISLVAVNGADSFWERCGFQRVDDAGIAGLLESYGPGRAYMVRSLAGEQAASRGE